MADLGKASNAANVGLFVLTAIGTAFVIWDRLRGTRVNGWGVPVFLASALLVSGALHIIASMARRKGEGKSEPKQDGNAESVRIAELEEQLRLTERERTALEKARDRTIEAYNNLGAQVNEMSWYVGRAKEQARRINGLLEVKVAVGPHELLRRDPYTEFQITITNNSMYDIELTDLVGSICLEGREFREQLDWVHKHKPRIIWSYNAAYYNFRQDLTEEDVEHIKSVRAHFHFGKLELRMKGTHDSAPHLDSTVVEWSLPPTNEALIQTLGESWSR